jgi:hexokinase
MNPTWVMELPRGDERGTFFTMDMGGTNFRVCKVTLDGTAGKYDVVQMDSKIPKSLKSGTAEQLWHYIADCLQHFVDRYSISQKELTETPLAFTFSYPVTQTSISHGILQRWTKGFDISGVEGTDVVAELQKVLKEKVSSCASEALPGQSMILTRTGSSRSDRRLGQRHSRYPDGIFLRRPQDRNR